MSQISLFHIDITYRKRTRCQAQVTSLKFCLCKFLVLFDFSKSDQIYCIYEYIWNEFKWNLFGKEQTKINHRWQIRHLCICLVLFDFWNRVKQIVFKCELNSTQYFVWYLISSNIRKQEESRWNFTETVYLVILSSISL